MSASTATGGNERTPARGARYHHGDLPSALMEAVGALIAREGVGAVSLRAAAREVGVSHAAPAHHFGDKRGLLTAFAQQGYEQFSRALSDAWRAAPADDPRAGLQAIGRAYIRFAQEHRAHYEVMFRPELIQADDLARTPATDDAFGVLCTAIAANLPDTPADDARVFRLAVVAWCTVHGLSQLWFDGPLQYMAGEWPLDALEQACNEALGAALDAEQHRPTP